MALDIRPGMRITAGMLRAMTPQAWLPWTPVWSTTTGTGKSAFGGGETISCVYTQAGSLVHISFEVTFSASTVFDAGTENWTFSLPVAAAASSRPVGHASLYTGDPDESVSGLAYLHDTGSFYMHFDAGAVNNSTAAGAVVDAQAPFAWSSGNRITVTGSYEAA